MFQSIKEDEEEKCRRYPSSTLKKPRRVSAKAKAPPRSVQPTMSEATTTRTVQESIPPTPQLDVDTQRLLWNLLSCPTVDTIPVPPLRRNLPPNVDAADRINAMSDNIDTIYDMFTGFVKVINEQSDGMNQQVQILLRL